MDNEEYMAHGEKLKQQGNESFKEGNLARAKRKYTRCVQIFEDQKFKDEERTKADTMLCSVKNNLALIGLKEGDYNETISKCNDVLNMDAQNGKALGRRGQAYLKLGEPETAKADFEAALKIMPKDAVCVIY